MRTCSITAIPTEYSGQVFRSRTEARFARWCDSWAVRWHYEPEGFNIGGVQYLPDFYLPECKTIVEVKPPIFAEELHKVMAMEEACRDYSVSFLIVTMDQKGCMALGLAKDEGGYRRWGFASDLFWATCNHCKRPHVCDGSGGWECPHCGAYDGDRYISFETFMGEETILNIGSERDRKPVELCRMAVQRGRCEQCNEYVFEGREGQDGTLICRECAISLNKD